MKEEPTWIHDIQHDRITSTGTGSSSEKAQEAALNGVKQEIVKRIASEITSDETVRTRAIEMNGKLDQTDEFNSTIRIKSANADFLSGISISKVLVYYWKKVKRNDAIFFEYVIQYPFAQLQLDSLIAGWNSKQAEYRLGLQKLEAKASSPYATVEEICRDKEFARFLSESMFNKGDITKATYLSSVYKQLLSTASITAQQTDVGRMSTELLINGKPIETENPPLLESSCIALESTKKTGPKYAMLFRYDKCNCKEPNAATLTYSFSEWYASATVPVDLSPICIGFEPYGTFKCEIAKANAVFGLGGTWMRSTNFEFKALYKGAFIINKIDYSYVRMGGVFGNKEITVGGTIDGLRILSNGRTIIPVKASQPINDYEVDQQNKTYNATVTVYFTEVNSKNANTATFGNVRFEVKKN